jgi:acyl carrier protein
MALESPELDPEESLSNLGLDSLMALELQHALEESFAVKLPIEALMGLPSLNDFASRLLEILSKAAPKPEQDVSQTVTGDNLKFNQSVPPIVEA